MKTRMIAYIRKMLGITALESKVELLYKSLNVGIDIHYKTDSWAVICLNGNPCYLNLVRLGRKDIREIHDFIKQYERHGTRNFFIDHPVGFQL